MLRIHWLICSLILGGSSHEIATDVISPTGRVYQSDRSSFGAIAKKTAENSSTIKDFGQNPTALQEESLSLATANSIDSRNEYLVSFLTEISRLFSLVIRGFISHFMGQYVDFTVGQSRGELYRGKERKSYRVEERNFLRAEERTGASWMSVMSPIFFRDIGQSVVKIFFLSIVRMVSPSLFETITSFSLIGALSSIG